MKMFRSVAVLGMGICVWAGTVRAEGGVGVTPKIGTLGYGVDVSVSVATQLNVRAGFQTMTYNWAVEMDRARLDGNVELKTIPILLDYYPGGGTFRISGGVMINDNKVVLSVDPNEPVELEGTKYRIDRLDGEIGFDQLAWYVGIGCGNAAAGGRVQFACDVGFMYHGAPQTTARAEANLPGPLKAQLDRDLETERVQFEEDISSLVLYPVVMVGILFAF